MAGLLDVTAFNYATRAVLLAGRLNDRNVNAWADGGLEELLQRKAMQTLQRLDRVPNGLEGLSDGVPFETAMVGDHAYWYQRVMDDEVGACTFSNVKTYKLMTTEELDGRHIHPLGPNAW